MKWNNRSLINHSVLSLHFRHLLTIHLQAIQEATASDRLTLEEEYENQESWRASHDKMTFIVCQPLLSTSEGQDEVLAGIVDAPDKMVGDINLFLSPYDDDDDDQQPANTYIGEVDVMIANAKDQGRGTGKAAVLAFLQYISRNLGRILHEYHHQEKEGQSTTEPKPTLSLLMAKINQGNAKSIALFKSLGFEQEGEVNYFGEVKLVLREFTQKFGENTNCPVGYRELVYTRAEEAKQ